MGTHLFKLVTSTENTLRSQAPLVSAGSTVLSLPAIKSLEGKNCEPHEYS